MPPTLKILGVVSRFLYSGGWQVWLCEDLPLAGQPQNICMKCKISNNIMILDFMILTMYIMHM